MLEAIDGAGLAPARAVIVQAEGGRPLLAEALAARGTRVEVAALHRTVPVRLEREQLAALAGADAVLFASGSAARSVADSLRASGATDLQAALGSARPIAIGPTTAAALAELGLTPAAVAEPHTLDGLLAATISLFSGSA